MGRSVQRATLSVVPNAYKTKIKQKTNRQDCLVVNATIAHELQMLWHAMTRVLPNVKRAFISQEVKLVRAPVKSVRIMMSIVWSAKAASCAPSAAQISFTSIRRANARVVVGGTRRITKKQKDASAQTAIIGPLSDAGSVPKPYQTVSSA